MISDFKFFQKGNNPTPEQLRKYHKRLLNKYIYEFNLYPGQPNYHSGGLINDQTIHFINQGHITSYNEIRLYYVENYRFLSNHTDIISDDDHHEFIRSVERPEAIHIGDLMGEMINSIQVLNEQVRNNS
jgi:hypothetical protein